MGIGHAKEARTHAPPSRHGHHPPILPLISTRAVAHETEPALSGAEGDPQPPVPPTTAENLTIPADLEGSPEGEPGYVPNHVYAITSTYLHAMPNAPRLDKLATSIKAGYNSFSVVPNLGTHTCLTELLLYYNHIRVVGSLPASLTRLDLSNNSRLHTLPLSICTLVNLKELSLTSTSLSCIPDEIRNCALLEELRVDHNYLTAVPAAIGSLGALRWLYLNNNQLSSLPGSIVQLHALQTFDLHSNRGWLGRRLGTTPDAIMKRLNEMDLLTGVEYVSDLKAMINNPTFSDVRLVTDDGTLDLHRFMLCRCPAFRAHLRELRLRAPADTPDGSHAPAPALACAASPLQLSLSDDFEGLSMLVEYIYTRRVPRAAFASPAAVADFAALAERYQLLELAAWMRRPEPVVEEGDPLFEADLRELLNGRDAETDVEIRLPDGTRVACHRAMLAARSDYYLCLFQSGLAESKAASLASPADFSADVMRVLLAWLYSSDRELLTGENAVELLVAADRLRVETLRSAAQAYLLSGLEADNAAYMWALARTHRAKHLELASCELMKGSPRALIVQSSTWSMLTREEASLLAPIWSAR